MKGYISRLVSAAEDIILSQVEDLAEAISDCMAEDKQVFLCGNGGSAANAIHIANDLVLMGVRAEALSANQAVITCIGNDDGYEHIFGFPLSIKADRGDVLIVLSGSGNSKNILWALKLADEMGLNTFGLLGYDGGFAKDMVDVAIHFDVNDMQVCEDLQLVVGHMVMRGLS